jgi:hypothetical protein
MVTEAGNAVDMAFASELEFDDYRDHVAVFKVYDKVAPRLRQPILSLAEAQFAAAQRGVHLEVQDRKFDQSCERTRSRLVARFCAQ